MKFTRRHFLTSVSMLAASTALPINTFAFGGDKKLKIVLVGTGIRGISFWGKRLQDKIFKNKDMEDPYNRSAGLRDGELCLQ